MQLLWIKLPNETLVGESTAHLSRGDYPQAVQNPMVMQYVQMQQPGKVLSGQQRQMVTGFKLVPIPCSEIFLSSVSYWGEIGPKDPVAVTYYQVRESLKEQAESPLQIAQ